MSKKNKKDDSKTVFTLEKKNFRILAIGFAIIVIGYILMSGGAADNPEVFNPDVFNFRRITLAPLMILCGYGLGIWAIMKKPSSEKE